MGRKRKVIKFDQVITGRVPIVVFNAVEKYIHDQQKDGFPRYNQGDLIRASVVKFLKNKKYLNEGDQYL
jgi:phosphoribulokinase